MKEVDVGRGCRWGLSSGPHGDVHCTSSRHFRDIFMPTLAKTYWKGCFS